MWNKIKTIIITVLATLGVLFIILMLLPDDEDEADNATASPVQVAQQTLDDQETDDATDPTEVPEASKEQETPQLQEDVEETPTENHHSGTVTVDIPASEISDRKLKFTTRTLDGEKVDQEIFSDYDLTLVHVWGTFCNPCIAEMGDYANFYETAPENVNVIAIVCDVYDGLDNNVDDANSILRDAGAEFMNLRTSDSVYDVIEEIQVIPSSFFVDGEGHIIGEIMMGQGYDATISRLNEYIK